MGNNFTCPFASSSDLDNTIQSILVNSIGFGDNAKKTTQRSISFKGHAADTEVSKSLSSGKRKMAVERSISFKRRQYETMVSVSKDEEGKYVPSSCISSKSNEMDEEQLSQISLQTRSEEASHPSPFSVNVEIPKHEAALKLQKVYKSFRTRRKLADCAVIAEQSWWKLLDFAELNHSSISFFDIEHHETAISRWSRAKTRAAKVGKGLSKSDRAQKLALQHWLEAIDPRHRYGHNLHFYYVKWLHSQSREPFFFYWLDIGEGKEVNLEKCPRWKLQQQCIKYLGPMGRKAYEVVVENGKLFYLQSGELLDTSSEPNAKWIFVLSTSKTLYVGKKKKGTFQHSSFLAGGATSAAGRLVVDNGILRAVWPHSGHYKPTEENFQDFILYLKENNVDLTDVKMDPVDDDEASLGKQRSSHHFRTCSSEEDLTEEKGKSNNAVEMDVRGWTAAAEEEAADAAQQSKPGHFQRLFRKLTNLQIPRKDELLVKMQSENNVPTPSLSSSQMDAPSQGGSENPTGSEYEDKVTEQNVSEYDGYEENREIIPKESILQRINSHKEAKSYQLGRQLSCKWTSGAGPRIGCVRDYPSELQAMALEQVCLSPRSPGLSKSIYSSPRYMTSKAMALTTAGTSFSHGIVRTQSSPLAAEVKSNSYAAAQLKQQS